MSLSPRHRWCAKWILFCFTRGDENFEGLDESKVNAFIRKPKVFDKFNSFFNGEGPGALIVHYQPKDVDEFEVRVKEICDVVNYHCD